MSPLLCGSPGSGGVLTWGSVSARPLVHGGELQPQLQPLPRPRLGCRARRSVWDRTAVVTGIYAHSGADAVGRSAAASDLGSGRARSAASGQCTPCRTCRTASAHPRVGTDFTPHGGSQADDQHCQTGPGRARSGGAVLAVAGPGPAQAMAVAARLCADGRRISRRTLRAGGVRGSNADLGTLARIITAQPSAKEPGTPPTAIVP